MKRIFALIMAIAMIICTASCSSKEKFEILEVGGYDYSSGADHKDEISLAGERYTDVLFYETTKNITIDGTEYKLKYKESDRWPYYNGVRDIYSYSDDKIFIQIGINRTTGIMDIYNLLHKEEGYYTQSPKTSEERLEIAKKYLSEYVDDISEYKLTEEHTGSIKGYRFERYIDNVKTGETASIGMSEGGIIKGHTFFSLGEMKDAKLPSEKSISEVEKEIGKRVEKIYSSHPKFEGTYEIKSPVFQKMSDGRYGFIYDVEVDLGGDGGWAELVRFAVYIN